MIFCRLPGLDEQNVLACFSLQNPAIYRKPGLSKSRERDGHCQSKQACYESLFPHQKRYANLTFQVRGAPRTRERANLLVDKTSETRIEVGPSMFR